MWKNRIIWLCLILALGGLALLAYQGIYNRYWADDWCYDASVLHRGLLGAVQGYFDTSTYATNRFSLTLFSGFLAPLWVPGVELLPLAVILLWLGGLYWDVRGLARLLSLDLDRKTTLLAASLLLTFFLGLAPNPFQDLMWRTGMLTYTAPLLGITWLAGRFILQARRGEKKPGFLGKPGFWQGALIAGLSAFLIGGFSEAGCALLLSGLVLGLAGVALLRVGAVREPPLRSLLPMFAAALLGGLIALALLLLSPMNEPRRLASYAAPMPLAQVPFMALKFAYTYIRSFFSFNRWALLALASGGLGFGFFSARVGAVPYRMLRDREPPLQEPPLRLRRLAVGLLFTGVVVFLLVAAVNVPAAYVENDGLSEGRALLVPVTLLVLGIAAAAWQAGCALRGWLAAKRRGGSRSHSRSTLQGSILQGTASARTAPASLAPPGRTGWRVMLALMALLALAPTAYAVTRYPAALAPLALFQQRARAWDARDAAIRQAAAAGKSSVEVEQIDAYAGILELYPQPNWVNNCAASFYGIPQIYATLPWNP